MSTPNTEWWKNFYSGLWLDVLRQFKTEEQTRVEAGFIERGLQLNPRAQVLDVPCGAGRLCLELASRGYHMTGVDFTLTLLDDARRKATQRQLEIAWEYRDMRDLPWKEEFDGAFCFGGSFGYFDEKGNADFLKAVSGTLKPGAKFLVDAIIAETHLPRSQDCAWVQVGDILVLQKLHYDHVSSRVDFEWMLVYEGKVEKKSSSIRLYTYYRELCQLFEEVGFVDCEGYGSLSQEPFKLGSQRFYLAAAKKGV
jgi:cyclopropane fatty-acyl-phospholipid synthase-like methyltransferase